MNTALEVQSNTPRVKPFRLEDAGVAIRKWILEKSNWRITSVTTDTQANPSEIVFNPTDNPKVICKMATKSYSIGLVTNIEEVIIEWYAEIQLANSGGAETVLATTPSFTSKEILEKHIESNFADFLSSKILTKETIKFLNDE